MRHLKVVSREPSKAEIVDEYGELDRKIQAFKPTTDRHEALKKQIKSWYEDHPADQTATATGALYEVQISARETERKAVITKVYNAVGLRKFLKIATVTLKALTACIGEEKAAALIVESQTGSRKLRAVRTAAPAIAEPAA